MHVIIIGAGEVGSYLAQILIEEKHDVCIVEQDEQVVHDLDQRLDASVIHGTGVSREVLFRAGIKKADMLIAITRVDEVNLIAAMTAEKIHPECRTVVRVRDRRYITGTDAIAAGDYGVDFLVSPEQAVAQHVTDLVRYVGPGQVSAVGDGLVTLLEIPVTAHSPLAYATSAEVEGAAPPGTVIGAHINKDGLRLCTPESRFEIGDRVVLLVPNDDVTEFLKVLSEGTRPLRRVLLIGGGAVGEAVARSLQSNRMDTTLIELDGDRAEKLATKLSRVNVINGDATDTALLARQLNDGQDAVVVLLSHNETSLWLGAVAKFHGIPKVIVRAGKRGYAPIAFKHGIDAVISPRRAMADAILRYVRRGHVNSTVMLGDHEGELIEFQVAKSPGHGITETPVKELKLPDEAAIAMLLRDTKAVLIDDETTIKPGDRVLAFVLRKAVPKIDAFFS